MTSNLNGIDISGLSASYGRREVVKSISLGPVKRGRFLALLGPNAAGKSTLLKSIAGIGSFRGTVGLDGIDMAGIAPAKRAQFIAYMPQSQPPAIGLTVLEAVMSALGGTRGREASVRDAYRALEDLAAANLALKSLSELSGGQRQIVALAQAIIRGPDVLLLDEPTSALDLRHQVFVMQSAARFARSKNAIVIAVLHDVSLAVRYADEIAILKEGELIAHGPASSVITPEMLGEVYGVKARIEICSLGKMQIIVDGVLHNDLENHPSFASEML